MSRLSVVLALVCASFAACQGAAAKTLIIANARIIVGTGQVIDKGAIVVKDGKIVSVAAGRAPASAKGERIDASGMTVIAGYIDDHRHIIQGAGPTPFGLTNTGTVDGFLKDGAADAMRDLLEAGFTTVQSGGDDNAGILKLKQMIDSGQIKGPRIVSSVSVPVSRMASEAQVRAAIDAAHASGADSIAEVPYPFPFPNPKAQWPFAPGEQETKNLAAALDEAAKLNMPFQIHAVSPDAMVAAVRLGAKRLVHSSHYAWLTDDQAKEIKASGAIVASSTNVPGAVFDVYSHDNQPAYRDSRPWPDGGPKGEAGGEPDGRSAAFMPLNFRTLFDNGVEVSFSGDAMAYTMHSPYNANEVLKQELKTLNLVFSPIDMIRIMGQNSADFVYRGKDLGTLEPGKLADINILTGNPLDGYWNFLRPVVVIKGGEIVVDKRKQLHTVKAL